MEPRQQLAEKLAALRSLNPDTARMLRGELLELAGRTGPAGFGETAAFAEQLADEYAASPWKRAESAALRDYFTRLERAAEQRKLAVAGEPEEAGDPAVAGSSVSLVPAHLFSGADWCRLHAAAEIPDRLLAAVDAAQNRNRWVESVLETIFLILQELDGARAMEWQLAFLGERRGRLDADTVRDLLSAWERLKALPPPAVEWLLDWSADEGLGRQWPVVVGLADRLLRRIALKNWREAGPGAKHAGIAHLQKLTDDGRLDDGALENWLASGLGEIGERVPYFLSFSAEEAPDAAADDWRRTALFREVRALGVYFVPVLLLADIPLRVPGGANRFALAFFGLGRAGMAQWRRRLDALAEKAVRRMFLAGLKEGERPADTIRKLGEGDSALCEKLLAMLDLATGQFDSLAQRDKVVARLATHYLNLREHRLLATEIQRRYRRLMRVLHPDSLGRLLTPEQLAELGGAGVCTEMMAVATAAKRFVERRRDPEQQVEEWVAADLEFTREIRRRRHHHLRGLAVR